MKTTNNKVPGQKAAFGLQQSRHTSMKWYHFSLLKQFPLCLDNPKSFRLVGNWLERQLGPSAYDNWQALPRSWSSTSPSSFFAAANWMWATIPTPSSLLPNLFIWGCHWPPGYTGHPNQTWHSGVEESSLHSLPGATLAEQIHTVLEVPSTPSLFSNFMKPPSIIFTRQHSTAVLSLTGGHEAFLQQIKWDQEQKLLFV